MFSLIYYFSQIFWRSIFEPNDIVRFLRFHEFAWQDGRFRHKSEDGWKECEATVGEQ
jgi:hypothetical protein